MIQNHNSGQTMTQQNSFQEHINMDSVQAIHNVNYTDLPIDIASFFRALWRRKWTIMIIWIIFQTIALYSALTATPVYESRAALELKVLPALPKSELHSETSMSKVNEKKYMEAMKRLLSSRKLGMMVIKQLGLHKKDTGFQDAVQINSPKNGKQVLSEEDQIKAYVGLFLNDLSVSIEKGGVTGVINLGFTNESPKKSYDILTELIEQFWMIMYERPEIAFSKERNHMKQMIKEAQKKLDVAYDTLNAFLSENDIFFLENIDVMTKKDIEITSSQLLELSKKSEEASIARIKAQTIWQLAASDPKGVEEVTENDLVITLKGELALAEAELAKLSVIYTPKASRRKAVQAKVASLKKAVVNERNTILETIRHNFEKEQLKEKTIVAEVEKMKAYVIRKKALKGEYDAIGAEIEINRKVYQSVLQQYEALKIETLFPFTLNMIDPPLLPHRPIKPRKSIRVMLGCILGIVFGASLALLIEFTNPGLRAPVEAERRTGLPVLGTVPPVKAIKELNVMNEFQRFQELEGWPEFNRAFNDTVGILLSKPGISVSVTSPKPEEDKALVALGLCRPLIHAGKKVLIVDADFSDNRLDKIFNLENEPGLLDILAEKVRNPEYHHPVCSKKTVLNSAGGGNLYALKTGITKNRNTPLGLIETPAFVKMLEQYKTETDYIIIISPPLLREVASYIINRATDTTLLVLQERSSKIKEAVRATEVMVRVGISISGLIVTESESSSH